MFAHLGTCDFTEMQTVIFLNNTFPSVRIILMAVYYSVQHSFSSFILIASYAVKWYSESTEGLTLPRSKKEPSCTQFDYVLGSYCCCNELPNLGT